MTLQTLSLLVFTAVGTLSAPALHARPTPPPLEDPAHWATVTHAGNAPYTLNLPFGQTRQIGQVNYEYRISKTEVTANEWIQFVQAYKPYVDPAYRASALFTSILIRREFQPDGSINYSVAPGAENAAINVGFRFAARYTNWLHNDKGTTQAAFESGAYDTSTFGDLPNFGFTDQATRSPGSKYWMPSENEWIKAGYFDPNRYGPNQPGYWDQPNGTNTPLVSGPPGVGQTSAGGNGGPFPVGSYPLVTSPWGLLDVSGGEAEWCEDVVADRFTGVPTYRLKRGSYYFESGYDLSDPIYGHVNGGFMLSGFGGVRLASIVPSPSVSSGVALVTLLSVLRRRR